MIKSIIQSLEIQDSTSKKKITCKQLYLNKKIESHILNKNKKIQ